MKFLPLAVRENMAAHLLHEDHVSPGDLLPLQVLVERLRAVDAHVTKLLGVAMTIEEGVEDLLNDQADARVSIHRQPLQQQLHELGSEGIGDVDCSGKAFFESENRKNARDLQRWPLFFLLFVPSKYEAALVNF